MDRPEQVDLFGDPNINNIGVPPVTTSSVMVAKEPAMTYGPIYNGQSFGRAYTIVPGSIAITAIVALCASVGLWLGWRKLSNRDQYTYVPVVR
jgi:hypothetical protein